MVHTSSQTTLQGPVTSASLLVDLKRIYDAACPNTQLERNNGRVQLTSGETIDFEYGISELVIPTNMILTEAAED